jgi:hypothetical protein
VTQLDVELPSNTIEVRVREVAQLFHTLDPFPFRERDLDGEVEDYIVGWARELRSEEPLRIIVHLPKSEAAANHAGELEEAFQHYFTYRAQVISHELNELMRIGRFSLLVGLSILTVCLVTSHLAALYLTDQTFSSLVEQSFLILGWVANWRPLEIFLYDWWPLARHRRLYRRLAAAVVEVCPYEPPTTD